MMRALLFLGIAGAIIYGFLVITGSALSGGNTKDSLTIQAKPNHSDDRLSSWDSYLPSRSQSRNPELASSQQPVTLPSQGTSGPSQDSGVYRLALAASKNRDRASDDSLPVIAPASAEVDPAPAQVAVAAESTNELTTKPPVRKSSKRSRSAKHGAVVAAADPWNGRWARPAYHRGFFGLFMFHPAPRAMSLGR